MARENQGLQVALIVFVMLTVVLGASTVYFFNVSEDHQASAKKANAEADKSGIAHREKIVESNALKKIIGVASTENMETIRTLSEDEFQVYGGTFPADDRDYRQLLKHMFEQSAQKDSDLVVARAENVDLNDKLGERTAREQVAIGGFEARVGKLGAQLNIVTEGYETSRNLSSEEQRKAAEAQKAAHEKNSKNIKEFQNKLRGTNAQLEKLGRLNEAQSRKIEGINKETFEVPDGEIRWVNQKTGTVWINLGRSDRLMRQVTFSVYPANISDLSHGGKKASIEVIRLLGENSAEARIIEDKITDPIMPGDKIHTPTWSPGIQKRFALAGLLDINGDGRSDLDKVRHIITMNGGVVDCYYNAKGEQVGNISIDTQFLVLGEAPDERGNPKLTTAYSLMVQEAGRSGSTKKISLDDLLNRMGHKKGTATGSGGTSPKSTGSGSRFKSRRPPVRSNGAY